MITRKESTPGRAEERKRIKRRKESSSGSSEVVKARRSVVERRKEEIGRAMQEGKSVSRSRVKNFRFCSWTSEKSKRQERKQSAIFNINR